MPLTVGDQIARLIGAPPGSVSMHQNVTIAEAVVLSCFGFDGPRRRIVYEEGNFPSVRYLYQAQRGADIVVAADDEGVVEAIDERTLLVPISHVLFKTGRDPGRRGDRRAAHEVGALVVLDAYQSVGTVPLDVTALGVDFAVGGSVKWLCGGPGAGWLYVRPDLAATLEPALTGWQAHARPFAFEPEQDYAEGAARFLTGTPNVPALYAATAGYDVIEEVGIERIRGRSREQTALLIELLDEAGFAVGSPRDPAGAAGRSSCKCRTSKRVDRELGERAASSATAGRTSACGSGRTSSPPTTSSGSRSSRSSSSAGEQLRQPLRVARRGRLVLVLEVAVDPMPSSSSGRSRSAQPRRASSS